MMSNTVKLVSHNLKLYDRVRWSDTWLRRISIEPNPDRLVGFITKNDIRAGQYCYEVCFEKGESVTYILASAEMLERVDA